MIVQFTLERHPDLADVPFIFDLAKTDEERQILTLWAAPNQMGRSYFISPGAPPATVNVLRHAFDVTLKNPADLSDAAQIGAGANAMTGDEVESLVKKVYATSKKRRRQS